MTALHQIMTQFWAVAMQDKPPPKLPGHPIEAIRAFAHALKDTELNLSQWKLDTEPNPYPIIALVPFPSPSDLVASIRVSGLLAFHLPWLQGFSFYVDPIVDQYGKHRAYIRDEEALPGSAWGSFSCLENGLQWLLESNSDDGQDIPVNQDEWEQSGQSGAFILESIVDASLGHLWESVADNNWQTYPSTVIEQNFPKDGRWARRICLSFLGQLLTDQAITFPSDYGIEDLTSPHRVFCDHLLSLEAARDGTIPPWIQEIAEERGPEKRLAERAKQWIERFQASR